MTATDHTASIRNHGYTVGYQRGQQDGQAETLGRYTRDPSHEGHEGEPPHLDEAELAQWTDGFLSGYTDGREDGMRGGA